MREEVQRWGRGVLKLLVELSTDAFVGNVFETVVEEVQFDVFDCHRFDDVVLELLRSEFDGVLIRRLELFVLGRRCHVVRWFTFRRSVDLLDVHARRVRGPCV